MAENRGASVMFQSVQLATSVGTSGYVSWCALVDGWSGLSG